MVANRVWMWTHEDREVQDQRLLYFTLSGFAVNAPGSCSCRLTVNVFTLLRKWHHLALLTRSRFFWGHSHFTLCLSGGVESSSAHFCVALVAPWVHLERFMCFCEFIVNSCHPKAERTRREKEADKTKMKAFSGMAGKTLWGGTFVNAA